MVGQLQYNPKLRVWVTSYGLSQYRHYCKTVIFKGIKYPKPKQLVRHVDILKQAMDFCGVEMDKIDCPVKKEAVMEGFSANIVEVLRKTRYGIAQSIRTIMIRTYEI